MKSLFPMLRALASLAPLLSTTPSSASTWWVDDDGGPGIDFTDVQSAIDAATEGDTIFVFPGQYTSFAVDENLTVVSSPSPMRAIVDGQITVSNVTGQDRTIIGGFLASRVVVSACAGTVVLDSLQVFDPGGSSTMLDARDSMDVRAFRCSLGAWDLVGSDASSTPVVIVRDARLELSQCSVQGLQGEYSSLYVNNCQGEDGGDAIQCFGSAELFVFRTDVRGGVGGDAEGYIDCCGGDGGDAVQARESSRVWIAGRVFDSLSGGNGGSALTIGYWCSGGTGEGLFARGKASIRYSGVAPSSLDITSNGPVVTPSPADPTLSIYGTFQAGRELQIRVDGPPGAYAALTLSHMPVVRSLPGEDMDELVQPGHTFQLGPVDASGTASFRFVLPRDLSLGYSLFAQAEVTPVGGTRTRTNSVPIVISYLP